MAKKRLTFEVEEELHHRLKAEAAQQGIPLGAHCAAILTVGGGVPHPSTTVEDLDHATLSSLPLTELRELAKRMANGQTEDRRHAVGRVNSEIMRRYKI